MRSFVSRLTPKIISFRNYKKFDETKFLADMKNTNFSFTSADPNENYLFLTNSFSRIVEKHVPLKKKTLRENHAPFVSKELRKAIYTISRFRNWFQEIPTKLTVNYTSSNDANVSLFEETQSIFLTLQVIG